MIDTFDKHGGSATEANEKRRQSPSNWDETERQVEESPATKRKKCWKL